MLQALQTATAPETLSVCPVVRSLVVDSLFPTLDRIERMEKAGGVQPGVGVPSTPAGVVAPGKRQWNIKKGDVSFFITSKYFVFVLGRCIFFFFV